MKTKRQKYRVSPKMKRRITTWAALLSLTLLTLFSLFLCDLFATNFPAAAWHRGDVAHGQENSLKAIESAFRSASPNIEVDVIDFITEAGKRVGLLTHENSMGRITGIEGKFSSYRSIYELPQNSADPDLSPEPFMTLIELFNLIADVKEQGLKPIVSLDLKEDGKAGKVFGEWVGRLIKDYGFQDHVFASSFFRSNVEGVKQACPECQTGGLVFDDHYALKFLDHGHSTLDLTGFSKATFFLGFFGKRKFPHDFVLIQDKIIFNEPELIEFWKTKRKVKFVGVFVYKRNKPFTKDEWKILEQVDWLELDPVQMAQFLSTKGLNK